jgi:hypothetical protein
MSSVGNISNSSDGQSTLPITSVEGSSSTSTGISHLIPNDARILPPDPNLPTQFEIAPGPNSNGSGDFPRPRGRVLTLAQTLAMHRRIVGATEWGNKAFDDVQDTWVSSVEAHMNRHGSMTEVTK